MDDMMKDVDADMAEAKRDEEESQKDYEEEMTKEGEKAEKTTKLEEDKELKRTKGDQLDVLETKLDNLHKTCDFLLEQYAKLKEERTKEEEGLHESKQII